MTDRLTAHNVKDVWVVAEEIGDDLRDSCPTLEGDLDLDRDRVALGPPDAVGDMLAAGDIAPKLALALPALTTPGPFDEEARGAYGVEMVQ